MGLFLFMPKLTRKQQRFVEEYLVDLNATRSAIRAGYSERTASRIGPELLGKTWVSAAVQDAVKKRSRRVEVSQDMVLRELAIIGFFDPAALFGPDGKPLPMQDMDKDARRAIAGLDVASIGNVNIGLGEIQKYKIANKLEALELLGRHLGMFTGRSDDNEEAPPVRVEIIRRDAGESP